MPQSVVHALPTDTGERVLSGAQDDDGHWHVGTDAALYLGSDDGYQRRPWEDIEHATWDRGTRTLAVVEVADYGQAQPRHVLAFDQPGRFLELVRERVTASVLLTMPVTVTGHGKRVVTAVARRSPTRTGSVGFSFRLDQDLDPDDPNVVEAARKGLEQVREQLGL